MNFEDFKSLFSKAADEAVQRAEKKYNLKLSRNYLVEFHGLSLQGEIISVNEALKLLYISDDAYFIIIDLMIKSYDEETTCFFVRPSGHPPSDFERTWSPTEFGPFRIMEI